LDVLLRCVRAAALVSHGVRPGVIVYLVLHGGALAPRILRIEATAAKFLRPDERSLSTLAKKALQANAAGEESGFVEVRPGISVRAGGFDALVPELHGAPIFVLDPKGTDLRDDKNLGADAVFVLGDHIGLDEATRAVLDGLGARPLCVGPLLLHAEDVVAIVSNELDRRECSGSLESPHQAP
jgi:tRNA (pseudouridine54-N1)-methyltransferase